MAIVQKIAPCLWFDGQAEDAARHYVSIFPNAGIENVTRFGKEGFEIHGRPAGSVMTVTFRLDGQRFTGLNGGPQFRFSEAVSFMVHCETQAEVDHYWERLGEGGDEAARQCGWLKDRFGLSWQVVPVALFDLLERDAATSERVMGALMQMRKLDIAALEAAAHAA